MNQNDVQDVIGVGQTASMKTILKLVTVITKIDKDSDKKIITKKNGSN